MTDTTQAAKHILLVEDDAGIAEPLTYALKRQGWDVTWHTHGNAALADIEKVDFDFIILDVGLPDTNGFDLCKQIRYDYQTPLLFLTAQNDEIDRILGLEIGADDYCAKPFSPREIVSRIKVIWRRIEQARDALPDNSPSAELTDIDWDIWQFNSKTYTITLSEKPLDVSKSELQLLLALLKHPTQVFSREQLLSHMSDHPEHRLPRTVDSHIKTIRQKIAKLTDADVIQTHRGIGYSLVSAAT